MTAILTLFRQADQFIDFVNARLSEVPLDSGRPLPDWRLVYDLLKSNGDKYVYFLPQYTEIIRLASIQYLLSSSPTQICYRPNTLTNQHF